MAKEIIINRMFSGSYLEDERNIGHEIINLYATDKNEKTEKSEFFVYIVPHGDYAATHEADKVEAVLMARGRGAQCVEIISKATGLKPIFNPQKYNKYKYKKKTTDIPQDAFWQGIPEKEKYTGWVGLSKDDFDTMGKANQYDGLNGTLPNKKYNFVTEHNNQCEKINNPYAPIKYGGVPLDALFSKNAEEYNMSIYMTFKAESIIKANKPFYLITQKALDNINDKEKIKDGCYKINGLLYFLVDRGNLSSTSTATFYSDTEKDGRNFATLERIINDSDNVGLWGDLIKPFDKNDISPNKTYSFLTLIKKEYDELAYSNMFAHFLDKYDCLLEALVDAVNNKYSTDIRLNHAVINTCVDTEDKKDNSKAETKNGEHTNRASNESSVNKKVHREKKNIDILIEDHKNKRTIVIENKIKSGINGERHDLNGKIIENQLDKYYAYVEKKYPDYNNNYFIFVPNYNRIDVDKFTTDNQRKFKPIFFKEIYDKFQECYEQNRSVFEKDIYFHDFLMAINRHSSEYDNNYEEVMKRKMKKLVEENQ